MSTLEVRREDLRKFVSSRLEGYRDRTMMYGPLMAVELQALQLLEMELFIKYPAVYETLPRAVMNAYIKALNERRYLGSVGLAQQVAPDLESSHDVKRIREEFGVILFDLCNRVRERLGLL